MVVTVKNGIGKTEKKIESRKLRFETDPAIVMAGLTRGYSNWISLKTSWTAGWP